MQLINFPLSNGRPRGREQTNIYITALDLKQEVDQVAHSLIGLNDDGKDLDRSPNGVAIDQREIYMGSNLRRGHVTGVASFQNTKEAPEQVTLQADVLPDKEANRTLTKRQDGDLVRYSRQYYRNPGIVEHLVHDTATDRMNYFLRNDKGQFVEQ